MNVLYIVKCVSRFEIVQQKCIGELDSKTTKCLDIKVL